MHKPKAQKLPSGTSQKTQCSNRLYKPQIELEIAKGNPMHNRQDLKEKEKALASVRLQEKKHKESINDLKQELQLHFIILKGLANKYNNTEVVYVYSW